MWGKPMDSGFCNSEGISLVGFLERSATIISSQRYVQTLKGSEKRIRRFRPNRKMNQAHLSCMTTADRTRQSLHEGRSCSSGVYCCPSFSIQYRFITLPRPPYWRLPEGCTPTTAFCGRQRACRAPTRSTHTHSEVGKMC